MKRHAEHSHSSETSPSQNWRGVLGDKQPLVLLGDRVDRDLVNERQEAFKKNLTEGVNYGDVGSMFHCRFCDQVFQTTEDTLDHIKTHSDEVNRSRDQDFEGKSGLLPIGPKEFTPEGYQVSFADEDTSDSHTSGQDSTPICNTCKKVFRTNFSLKRHIERFHAPEDDSFTSKKHLTARKSLVRYTSDSHAGDASKIFTCQDCFKEFASKSILAKHMVSHKHSSQSKSPTYQETELKEEDEKVDIDEEMDVGVENETAGEDGVEVDAAESEAPQSFTNMDKLSSKNVQGEPEESSLAAIVNECINKAITNVVVKEEDEAMEEESSTVDGDSDSTTDEKTMTETKSKMHKKLKNIIRQPAFKCTLCDRVFTKKTALKRHVKVRHFVKSHYCVECGQTFGRRNNLLRHIQRVHNEPAFECSECDKTFSVKYDLTRHMKCHMLKKVFPCSECNEEFQYKKDMKLHRRLVHKFAPQITDEEPVVIPDFVIKETGQAATVFRCSLCPRMFALKTDLLRHFLVHSGKKPFECEICDSKFNRKSNLVRHKKLMHNVTAITRKQREDDDYIWMEENEEKTKESSPNEDEQGVEVTVLNPTEKITVRILTF